MFGVVAIGMPLTLLSTAHVAFLVRKYVKTEMLDTPTADALPPFGRMHFITWGEFGPTWQRSIWGYLTTVFVKQGFPMTTLGLLQKKDFQKKTKEDKRKGKQNKTNLEKKEF